MVQPQSPGRSQGRSRADRCPGALRPWPAEDGLLVRLRLVGGRVSAEQLRALVAIAEEYGDGRVHLTGRANLQLRALPSVDDELDPRVVTAIEDAGLLPSRTHELVRNLMASPQTGLAGGRADLRPVADELDRTLCARPSLAGLSARFLFVLDDRGDLLDRSCDLGVVALDGCQGQLRVGSSWGPVLPLADVPAALADLAEQFVQRRGTGPEAPWHVTELPDPLVEPTPADPRLPAPAPPLGYGAVAGGTHVCAAEGIDAAFTDTISGPEVVVTPWRGVLLPNGAA